MKLGLVLTGGGARAAYQAGVLRGVSEIASSEKFPFEIVAGTSAGAINGTALSADADMPFRQATEKLWDVWRALTADDVFRTDPLSLLRIGTRWIRDLSLGGLLGSGHANHLLDTTPLRGLLEKWIDLKKVDAHLRSGRLRGVAVSATNYRSGTAIIFFDGAEDIEPWYRGTRYALRTKLSLEHVLASSAIPIFFPPVALRGSFYGDGCIRLTAPLSPAVHMGADRVLAIGIRYSRPRGLTLRLNDTTFDESVSIADIGGILLNAVFLDSLETDLERMERINRTIALLDEGQQKKHPDRLREIPVLAIKPSRDLGTLAHEHFGRFPRTLRHLLKGIGASDAKGWDLLSYLAFDSAYTGRLLELGFQDALEQREKIKAFLQE